MQPNQELFEQYFAPHVDDMKREALSRQELTHFLESLDTVQGQLVPHSNYDSKVLTDALLGSDIDYDERTHFIYDFYFDNRQPVKKVFRHHDQFTGDDGLTVQTRLVQFMAGTSNQDLGEAVTTNWKIFGLEVGVVGSETEEMQNGQCRVFIAWNTATQELNIGAVKDNPNIGKMVISEALVDVHDDEERVLAGHGRKDDRKFVFEPFNGVSKMQVIEEVKKALEVNQKLLPEA